MEINLVREILKTSLREHHGNRFDSTIDKLNIVRNDFRGKICYYHSKNYEFDPLNLIPYTPGEYYIIISFEEEDDRLNINTNLLFSKWFFYKYDREFLHGRDNPKDYDMDFNLKTKYNESLSSVLSEIRDNKLNEVLI